MLFGLRLNFMAVLDEISGCIKKDTEMQKRICFKVWTFDKILHLFSQFCFSYIFIQKGQKGAEVNFISATFCLTIS